MHKEVKSAADNGDIKKLRYIFVDSLDVDPTFVNYLDDLNYAKNVPEFFEKNQTLTPFRNDSSSWDVDYWIALKRDLQKNFSSERLEFMKKVAPLVHTEKYQRILAEREKKTQDRDMDKNATASIHTETLSGAAIHVQQSNVDYKKQESNKAAEREETHNGIDRGCLDNNGKVKHNKYVTNGAPVDEDTEYQNQKRREAAEQERLQREIKASNQAYAEQKRKEASELERPQREVRENNIKIEGYNQTAKKILGIVIVAALIVIILLIVFHIPQN